MKKLKEKLKDEKERIFKELVKEDILEKIGDKKYALKHNVHFLFHNSHREIITLTVPKGFVTNLASVPGMLEFIIAHDDKDIWLSCILHDFLYSPYSNYCINRKDSDDLFNLHMKTKGTPAHKRRLLYYTCRLFGSHFFRYKKVTGVEPIEKKALIDTSVEYKYYKEKYSRLFKEIK